MSIDVPEELRHARPTTVAANVAENAVKHGLHPCAAGVTVLARRSDPLDADAFLTLIVSDTGCGWSGGGAGARETRSGVGLENIESRLRHYFGASAAMVIRPTRGGGTTVELCLPLIGDRALAVAS